MIINGVVISNEKNKNMIGKGLKIVKKANGLSNVKKYGGGLKILK